MWDRRSDLNPLGTVGGRPEGDDGWLCLAGQKPIIPAPQEFRIADVPSLE